MLPAVLAAFFASQAILGATTSLADLLLALRRRPRGDRRRGLPDGLGVFALAIGAILRNTAGGISTFAGDHVRDPAADEHPADELEQRDLAVPPGQPQARSIFALSHGAHNLAPWPGFALFWVTRYAARAVAARHAALPPRHVTDR